MIINCINCDKKFDVNPSLIPDNGRTIQCSSCKHVWFYKPLIENISTKTPLEPIKDIVTNDEEINIEPKSQTLKNKESNTLEEININKKENINRKINRNFSDNKKNSFNFNKFLSYILVFIISFIALVILLDTFKNPLISTFPAFEIFLYNFFETVKDIYLFFKNLFL
tara:strand:- start:235 stop:738 length:504 start_codon:yes stop_codon:yes gene_type:complete